MNLLDRSRRKAQIGQVTMILTIPAQPRGNALDIAGGAPIAVTPGRAAHATLFNTEFRSAMKGGTAFVPQD